MSRTRLMTPPDQPPGSQGVDAPRALLESLAAQQGLLRGLLDTAREKLVAVRTADAAALHRCTARESRLLEQVVRIERERPAILARLAQSMRFELAARMSLNQLAEKFPEPLASAIRARSRVLGEIATELKRINAVASAVARDLHSHVRAVLSALSRANRETVGYGRAGQQELSASQSWLDAVG